jgi:hypothetical protein
MGKYDIKMKTYAVTVDADNKFHLSSPSKVSKKEHCSFSLPAGPDFSCPKATRACKNCYAKKGRFCFKSASIPLMKNWKLIKDYENRGKFERAVKRLTNAIPKKAKIFRIHSSGDFASQFYLNVWTEVIRQRREVKFWAYTRNFSLNFQKMVRQPNFVLFASTDKYNSKLADNFIKRYSKSFIRHAYGPWKHDEKIPDNSFICPVTSKKMLTDGACEKCKLCITKGKSKKSVVFLKH